MTPAPNLASLAPDTPFWAIGDVHGCDALLERLLDRLRPEGLPIVLVGDYINKGPDSAAVLRRLLALSEDRQIIALRGNHEDLFLRFLSRPIRQTRPFLRYGGRKTLESFGLTLPPEDAPPRAYVTLRDQIRSNMPGMQQWLHALPYVWQSGNISVLHAGADPTCALDAQPERGFAWGHPLFTTTARTDGRWIMHGHHPVDIVTAEALRIAIDTQAHATGQLSAVRVGQGSMDVVVA